MPYVALKRQKIKRGDSYVELQPGDPIPEADFWPNKETWERQKFIKEVHTLPKKAKVEVEVKEEAPPAVTESSSEEEIAIAPKSKSKTKKKTSKRRR